MQQSPTRDRQTQNDAGRSGKPRPLFAPFVRFGESLEVGVARAAGSEMIEPLLRFGEWYLMGGNFLENVSTGASDTLRIREFLEQTSPQGV